MHVSWQRRPVDPRLVAMRVLRHAGESRFRRKALGRPWSCIRLWEGLPVAGHDLRTNRGYRGVWWGSRQQRPRCGESGIRCEDPGDDGAQAAARHSRSGQAGQAIADMAAADILPMTARAPFASIERLAMARLLTSRRA